LVQDPQAVPCEELCLGGLTILLRSAVARGKRIGGGSVHHDRLTEPKRLAGPSAPSLAMPHTEFDLTPRVFMRAERHRCMRLPRSTRIKHHRWRRIPAQNWI